MRGVVGRVGLQDGVDVAFDDQAHTPWLEAAAFVAMPIDTHEQRADAAVAGETHHRAHGARVVMRRPGDGDGLPGAGLVGFRSSDREQEPAGGPGVGVAFEREVVDVYRDELGAPQSAGPPDEEECAVALDDRVGVGVPGEDRDRRDDPAEIVESEGDRPALGGPDPPPCPRHGGAYERVVGRGRPSGEREGVGDRRQAAVQSGDRQAAPDEDGDPPGDQVRVGVERVAAVGVAPGPEVLPVGLVGGDRCRRQRLRHQLAHRRRHRPCCRSRPWCQPRVGAHREAAGPQPFEPLPLIIVLGGRVEFLVVGVVGVFVEDRRRPPDPYVRGCSPRGRRAMVGRLVASSSGRRRVAIA